MCAPFKAGPTTFSFKAWHEVQLAVNNFSPSSAVCEKLVNEMLNSETTNKERNTVVMILIERVFEFVKNT